MKVNKHNLLLVLIAFWCQVNGSYGQDQSVTQPGTDSQAMKTLLVIPKPSFLGVYLVPEYQYGQLAGQFTSMAGGSAMLLINKKLGIGVSGYTTLHNFTPASISSDKSLQMQAQFGGAKIEYTLNPNSPVHVSFPLLIGGGRANIDSASRYHEAYGQPGMHESPHHGSEISFFVVQPGVTVEANLFRFMKIFAGGSYRIVSGGETRTLSGSTLSPPALGQMAGFSFNAGLKFGYDFYMHKKK